MKISRLLVLVVAVSIFNSCKTAPAADREDINFNYIKKIALNAAKNNFSEPNVIKNTITSEDYSSITFNQAMALWGRENLPYRLELFHLGYIYDTPITMYEFKGQYYQEIRFTNDLFTFDTDEKIKDEARSLQGYAGFKILCQLNKPKQFDELVSFLGDHRFRALGRENVYGLYALSNIVYDKNGNISPFDFTAFWIGKPDPNSDHVTIYALADSRYAVSAFQYDIYQGETTKMIVKSAVYPRENISTIGIAPMSTIYLYGSNTKDYSLDTYYRALHYSDGLVYSDNNINFFQPLENYPETVSSDHNTQKLKYFGLIQRDRNYENYKTAFAALQLVPNLIISPDNDWGKGKIKLIESKSNNENQSNIYACWTPDTALLKDKEYSFNYTMSWSSVDPNESSNLGIVKSTKTWTTKDSIFFAIRFNGPILKQLVAVTNLTAITTISNNAKIDGQVQIFKDMYDNNWVEIIKVKKIDPKEKDQTISISSTLYDKNNPVTETWTYKYALTNI